MRGKAKILAINCGSTSTKVAYFEDETMIHKISLDVSAQQLDAMPRVLDQLEIRMEQVREFLKANRLNPEEFDIIVARAGAIPPVMHDGAYEVNDLMVATLRYAAPAQHASTLSCLIGRELVKGTTIPVIIYDPDSVNSGDEIAKITGIPQIRDRTIAHLLNMKMVGRTYAKSIGKRYRDLNLIIAHLGGGITLGFHDHGRIADWVYDDEGAMSPQRAGAIPTRYMAELCYNSGMSFQEMQRYLCGKTGMVAYFGTQDVRDVERMAGEGDEQAELVLKAMAYGVAKSIGQLSVVRAGQVDQIILTGGVAFSERMTGWIQEKVSFIAPVTVLAGEMEMEALAAGALRALNGEEPIQPYDVYPEGYSSIEEIIAHPIHVKTGDS